jgi:hypothetical protein
MKNLRIGFAVPNISLIRFTCVENITNNHVSTRRHELPKDVKKDILTK